MSAIRLWKWFLLINLAVGLQCTGQELKPVEAIGEGRSREGAILKALTEAVRQAQGISIDTRQEVTSSFAELDEKTSITNLTTEFIQDKSQGLVSSYEILECEKTGQADVWTARVLAHLGVYKPLGLDRSNQRSILILPFGLAELRAPHLTTSSAELVRRLQHQLIAEITQSRRFRVISTEPEIEAQTRRPSSDATHNKGIAGLAQTCFNNSGRVNRQRRTRTFGPLMESRPISGSSQTYRRAD